MRMRTLILKIHLYLGLFCAPYLLIFGITSLNFNHSYSWMERHTEVTGQWESSVERPDTLGQDEITQSLQDSLGLMGWFIPWESSFDSTDYHITYLHPGKKYLLEMKPGSKRIRVSETNLGFGNILNALHGLGETVPHAPVWINAWQYYQDMTVYTLIFWTLSGVYLWFVKHRSRFTLVYGILFFVLSVSLMIYLWLAG